MNGTEPKIEIFKPFGEAFELMKRILFQPFDLKKWFVIGFAAFVAGHFGGVGFNFPTGFGKVGQPQPLQKIVPEGWQPWLPVIIIAFVVCFVALVIVLMWLKSRGSFIFTDCIVQNRAAIAQPWREYRKEGNSYFLFLLVVVLAFEDWQRVFPSLLGPGEKCAVLYFSQFIETSSTWSGHGCLLVLALHLADRLSGTASI